MKKTFDVIVIGGGPAGSSCAIALAKLGVQHIFALEDGDYSKFVIGESIPPNSKRILNSLGVFKDFLKENHLPCYGVCSYWGDDKRGYNDTVLSPFGHGWHLDRKKFNLFLSQQAEKSGVVVETNANFKKGVQLNNGKIAIGYTQNNEDIQVTAKFVVDASGSRSLFAKQQGSIQVQSTLVCQCHKLEQSLHLCQSDQPSSQTSASVSRSRRPSCLRCATSFLH